MALVTRMAARYKWDVGNEANGILAYNPLSNGEHRARQRHDHWLLGGCWLIEREEHRAHQRVKQNALLQCVHCAAFTVARGIAGCLPRGAVNL